jgi:hypothetical protein
MKPGKEQGSKNQIGKHEHPLPQEISMNEREQAANAYEQAEKDIDKDAELTAHNPNDDLDEGESARLGEDTELI